MLRSEPVGVQPFVKEVFAEELSLSPTAKRAPSSSAPTHTKYRNMGKMILLQRDSKLVEAALSDRLEKRA
jgi:hypothetical protein